MTPKALATCMVAVCFFAETARTEIPSDTTVYFHRDPGDPVSRYSEEEVRILEKLNRADRTHLEQMPEVIVPDTWHDDVLAYSPIPRSLDCTMQGKMLIVSLAAQVFGAFENSTLVRWGPVSSGREKYPTPVGRFHLNWKSEGRHSTDDPNWYMEWYFNFQNDRGLAFHQYSLPGRPASHGCIRLLERDAKWLYNWGESWSLSENGQEVTDPGTPVYIYGEYRFDSPQPWLDPSWWRPSPPVVFPGELCGCPANEALGCSEVYPPSVAVAR